MHHPCVVGALVKEAPQGEDLGISSLVPHSAKSDFPYSTDPLWHFRSLRGSALAWSLREQSFEGLRRKMAKGGIPERWALPSFKGPEPAPDRDGRSCQPLHE